MENHTILLHIIREKEIYRNRTFHLILHFLSFPSFLLLLELTILPTSLGSIYTFTAHPHTTISLF